MCTPIIGPIPFKHLFLCLSDKRLTSYIFNVTAKGVLNSWEIMRARLFCSILHIKAEQSTYNKLALLQSSPSLDSIFNEATISVPELS